jgi:homoserine dehydrogenase
VVIESGFADKQFFYGKGAGSFPTASAVLSDISALRYDYRYEYKKLYHHQPLQLATDYYLQVFISADDWTQLPKEELEWIAEWHSGQSRSYLKGLIHYSKLKESDWWKQPGISLILAPDAVIEPGELDKFRPAKRVHALDEAVA